MRHNTREKSTDEESVLEQLPDMKYEKGKLMTRERKGLSSKYTMMTDEILIYLL